MCHKIKGWIESSVILNWIKGDVVRIIIVVFLIVEIILCCIGCRDISIILGILLVIIAYICDEKILYAISALVPIFRVGFYAWHSILEIVKCNEATIVALGIGEAYGTIIAAFIAASMVCNQLYSKRVTKERSRWLTQLKKDVSKYLGTSNPNEKDELYYRVCFNLNNRDEYIDKEALKQLNLIQNQSNQDLYKTSNTEEIFQELFKFEWERIKIESEFSTLKIFPFNFIMIIIKEIRIEIEKGKAIKNIDEIIRQNNESSII